MDAVNYQLVLSFEQVSALVKQLPDTEKLQLSQELRKEVLDSKLTALLGSCETSELSLEAIAEEVEAVRSEIYARKSTH